MSRTPPAMDNGRVDASRDLASRMAGLAALFSGVALVVYILAGVSLALGLAATTATMILAVAATWRRTSGAARQHLVRVARVGAASGILATLAYDASKLALSQTAALTYNPFEAIHAFGIGLVGTAAAAALVYGAGTAFHLLNGVSFGISYCCLFGRRGIAAGIGWGFFLELFQLTLYPGWLDIRAYREFAQISALGHLVYGSVLGAACRRGLRGGTDLEGG